MGGDGGGGGNGRDGGVGNSEQTGNGRGVDHMAKLCCQCWHEHHRFTVCVWVLGGHRGWRGFEGANMEGRTNKMAYLCCRCCHELNGT